MHPPTMSYKQLRFDSMAEGWSPPIVRAALDAHENGLFVATARLADAFGRDERIASAVRTRALGALGLPFKIHPGIKGDPRAERLAASARQWWPNVGGKLSILRKDRLLMGFAAAQIHWAVNPQGIKYVRELERWWPGSVIWDLVGSRFQAMTENGGFVPISAGGFGKWFFEGSADSWMEGGVRFAAAPFLVRKYGLADWAHYTERHGFPIIVGKYPDGAKDHEREAFFSDLASIGRKGILRLPQTKEGDEHLSYAVDLLEASDTAWQNFPAIWAAMSVSIAIGFLGQHLTTETSESGSYALGREQGEVRQDLKEADELETRTDVQTQIMIPFALYNEGPGSEELAPIVEWITTTPTSEKLEAEADKAQAEAKKAEAEAIEARIRAAALAKKEGLALDAIELVKHGRVKFVFPPAGSTPPALPAARLELPEHNEPAGEGADS